MLDILLILTILLTNSLYIFGLWFSTQDGMINEWVDKLLKDKPEWVRMPVYNCPICMASVHSYILPIVTLAFGFSWTILWVWPFYIVMLAGLNGIVLSFVKPEKVEIGLIGKDVMVDIKGDGIYLYRVMDSVGGYYLCENESGSMTVIVHPSLITKVL